MNPRPSDSQVSDAIAALSAHPRVLVRRSGAPSREGICVVYWMQRSMRILDNPALDVAVEAANLLGVPVVIYFQVIPNYPNANLRHYHFLQQGLRDVAEGAATRELTFIVRRSPSRLEEFLEEVQAVLLVGDENPCREPERWRSLLARRLRIPYWTVDADVAVPSRVFGRSFALLHHFRPHLKAELPKYIDRLTVEPPHPHWKFHKRVERFSLAEDITLGFTRLDRSVGPVDTFTGGTHAALKRLHEFVTLDLKHYDEARKHPESRGTSRLSPYLRFGNIGPLTIVRAVKRAVAEGKASTAAGDKYLEQLIGWRELAVLFVRHETNYDNWDCAAPWARKSLIEHAGDPRPHRYALQQLERGATCDEVWNAAQREMVSTGWMHSYMRMYWAKKILEWAPDPSTAFDWAVLLNDRYQLDGRDPNGYAGIAWAIVGKLDRPWFNRPVFGLVRPMTGASISRKFDAKSYIRQNGGEI
jgi:deoxyribodipyrimidine photo-lyase